jgi:hypothetical protein
MSSFARSLPYRRAGCAGVNMVVHAGFFFHAKEARNKIPAFDSFP